MSVAIRPRATGETSLLIEVRGPAGKTASEVTVGLPSKLAGQAVPAHLPSGWSSRVEASSVRLSGPAASFPVRMRLDAPTGEAPARISVRVRQEGATLFDGETAVTRAPPVRIATKLDGLLLVPKAVRAGDTISCQALDAARTPAGGQWAVAGAAAEEVVSSRPGSTVRFRIPPTARAGDAIRVTYTDPWGEQLVDAPDAARCDGTAPPSVTAKPRVEACASMGFAGQSSCVCGLFPTDAAREGLTLNGKPLGPPTTASSGVVFVRIPAETPPGPAVIGGLESAGFSREDRATITILHVAGELDRTKLIRGQTTPMRLWVEGTTQVLKLHIVNDTPELIRLEGGNDQVAATDGKKPNGLTRTVYTILPGEFKITYTLDADPCPCTGETVVRQLTPPSGVTPTEERPTPTPLPGASVYPTFPPELRTREKSPSPTQTLVPTFTPTPRVTTGDSTRERSNTPTPPNTQERTYTPTPTPPTPPPPSVTPPTPTPTPTPQVECKLSYTIEGGPGISIDAVGPPPSKTAKTNEPIPLYVAASDMDQLLQTCTCFINKKEGSATHKLIDLPDTVQYRWRLLGGNGSLAGKAGPATLYRPPALKVNEADSASVEVQIVDLRDNDKPASVRFTITVKRVEECKYERTVAFDKKSDPGKKKEITDVHQAVECDPQDESWLKEPAPVQAQVPGKVKVCVGERALLTASASDTDTLKLQCAGPCGSDKQQPTMDDPVKYTWEADKGSFPDYGGHPTSDSDSTSIIYQAPPAPGNDTVRVHVRDSGKEATDAKVDKTIPVTAYKLSLSVEGDKDEDAPDCDAYFVCLNDDDDDEQGIVDLADPGKVGGEQDRVKVTLKMEPEKSGNVLLTAASGGDRIRVWDSQTKGKILPLPYAPPKLPVDVWIEGIKPSAAPRDVDLVLSSDDPHCEVHALFTVEGPELDMDGVAHAKRMNPGGSICVNKNFDMDPTKQVMDKDNPVADPAKEHDLVQITLDKNPKTGSVTFDVPAGGDKVHVWEASPNGQNLKGKRAEGNGYDASVLPVTLWVEGFAASNAARDVTLELTDDDSGCASQLKLTVVEVSLKAQMRDRSGAFIPVPDADRERKGAFVAVNEDDDDTSGRIDVKQHPVAGENDLLRLDLDIKPKPASGKITLQATAGSDHVQLWLEPTKGTALDLASGVTMGANTLPKSFWLEGYTASAAPHDVELKVSCTDPRPCEDRLKATAVSLHLQTDLDMNGVIDEKDWDLERKRGAYIVVNNDDDDGDGRADYMDDRVDAVAVPGYVPPAGAQAEQDLKMFQIAGPLPAALQNEGKVILRRSNANVAVYTVSQKGVGARILWSAPPGAAGGAAFAGATENNGMKTWDLSDAVQRAQFISLRDHLWVEGVSASGAERDTSLTLSYAAKDAGVEIEMNRIDITVVRFEKVTATIDPTPELPARVPANAPARHIFDNSDATTGIVYQLNENPTTDRNFEGNRALVLIRRGDDTVDLSVTRQPALALNWAVTRSADDAAALGKGLPGLNSAGPAAATLGTDERGSFLVYCYVDVNGNGRFDSGEPRALVPLILVQSDFSDDFSVAHNHITVSNITNAAGAVVAYRVSSAAAAGGFNVNSPVDAAIYTAATVDLTAGGPTGRRGLDRAFAGWIQDIPVDLGCTADYTGGHTVRYAFSRAPHPASKNILPGAAAPAFISTPIIDSNLGANGGVTVGSNSQVLTRSDLALGQRLLVRDVDSPGLAYFVRHPGFAGSTLTAFRFNLDFRVWLSVWTNGDGIYMPPAAAPAVAPASVAERTYSVVYQFDWILRGEWTPPAAAGGAPTVTTATDAQIQNTAAITPAAKAGDRNVSVRAPEAIVNLVRDARN